MATRRRQQLRELGLVAFAEGLLHFQQDIVATVLRQRRRGCGGPEGSRQKRCQNLQPVHGGNYLMDKAALRRSLIDQRLNLPDRLQRADALQQVMRFWLIQRPDTVRSEEHTSELQSPCNLVCRLLLQRKNR